MKRGFLYLAAIMDWFTRKVLSWRLSNTMDAEFCIEALRDALMRYGTPEIFNTDQGSQFTTPRFTGLLEERQIRISMDGRTPDEAYHDVPTPSGPGLTPDQRANSSAVRMAA